MSKAIEEIKFRVTIKKTFVRIKFVLEIYVHRQK